MFSRFFDRVLNTVYFCILCIPVYIILSLFNLSPENSDLVAIIVGVVVFGTYFLSISKIKTEDTWVATISEWINPTDKQNTISMNTQKNTQDSVNTALDKDDEELQKLITRINNK